MISEAAKMLPFLTAAGHHTYAQESLLLYLKEMKAVPLKAQAVHEAMMAGAFVDRSDWCHNGVPPDMVIEQSYNADMKEESGQDSITMNEAAKWMCTKPLTIAIASHLDSWKCYMLCLIQRRMIIVVLAKLIWIDV